MEMDGLGTIHCELCLSRVLCQGQIRFAPANQIWKCYTPLKAKILSWLAVQYRLRTSDRRFRHGLQDSTSPCFVCLQEEDTSDHILVQCSHARQVWFICFRKLQLQTEIPETDSTLEEWWTEQRLRFTERKLRRRFDTLVIPITWSLWKHRNAWVFGNSRQQLTTEHGHEDLGGIQAMDHSGCRCRCSEW